MTDRHRRRFPDVTRTLRAIAPALALVLASYAVPASGVPASAVTSVADDGAAADGSGGSAGSAWTKGRSGVLRDGCRTYTYRYRVEASTESWSLEVRVVDPTGTSVANDHLFAEDEPARGKRRYVLCRPSTRPGTFRIKARLVTLEGWTREVVEVRTSRHRLRAPR